jgi:hypothetical protein
MYFSEGVHQVSEGPCSPRPCRARAKDNWIPGVAASSAGLTPGYDSCTAPRRRHQLKT